MSKKPLSDMSAQDFLTIMGALGIDGTTLAQRLDRSTTAVSRYRTGSMPIPMDVAEKLRHMINERRATLAALYDGPLTSVEEILVASNTLKPKELRQDRRLAHRAQSPVTTTFPPYRLAPGRVRTYIRALEAWLEFVTGRVTSPTSETELASMKLERVDVAALLESARGIQSRGAPYNIVITHAEWLPVSRALRHLASHHEDPHAFAMYQHWRKHKGTGFPRTKEQRGEKAQ